MQIPAGVATGQYMTLRGLGNAGPRGGPRGDVLVVFDVADEISVLHFGEILETGTPEDIKRSSRVQEIYLGVG